MSDGRVSPKALKHALNEYYSKDNAERSPDEIAVLVDAFTEKASKMNKDNNPFFYDELLSQVMASNLNIESLVHNPNVTSKMIDSAKKVAMKKFEEYQASFLSQEQQLNDSFEIQELETDAKNLTREQIVDYFENVDYSQVLEAEYFEMATMDIRAWAMGTKPEVAKAMLSKFEKAMGLDEGVLTDDYDNLMESINQEQKQGQNQDSQVVPEGELNSSSVTKSNERTLFQQSDESGARARLAMKYYAMILSCKEHGEEIPESSMVMQLEKDMHELGFDNIEAKNAIRGLISLSLSPENLQSISREGEVLTPEIDNSKTVSSSVTYLAIDKAVVENYFKGQFSIIPDYYDSARITEDKQPEEIQTEDKQFDPGQIFAEDEDLFAGDDFEEDFELDGSMESDLVVDEEKTTVDAGTIGAGNIGFLQSLGQEEPTDYTRFDEFKDLADDGEEKGSKIGAMFASIKNFFKKAFGPKQKRLGPAQAEKVEDLGGGWKQTSIDGGGSLDSPLASIKKIFREKSDEMMKAATTPKKEPEMVNQFYAGNGSKAIDFNKSLSPERYHNMPEPQPTMSQSQTAGKNISTNDKNEEGLEIG